MSCDACGKWHGHARGGRSGSEDRWRAGIFSSPTADALSGPAWRTRSRLPPSPPRVMRQSGASFIPRTAAVVQYRARVSQPESERNAAGCRADGRLLRELTAVLVVGWPCLRDEPGSEVLWGGGGGPPCMRLTKSRDRSLLVERGHLRHLLKQALASPAAAVTAVKKRVDHVNSV